MRGEGGEVVVGGEGNAVGGGGEGEEKREGAAALLPPTDVERRGGGETSEEAGPTTTTTSATLREGGEGGRGQTILSNQLESNLSTSLAKGKGQCYYSLVKCSYDVCYIFVIFSAHLAKCFNSALIIL